MKGRQLLSAAVLLTATALTPAYADMKMVHQTGEWQTGVGYSFQGHPMCETGIDGPLQREHVMAGLWFKWDTHMPTVTAIQIFKEDWAIPEGTRVHVQLQIDYAPPRVYNAISYHGDMVEIQLTANDHDALTGELSTQLLSNLLRNGLQLHVSFPDYGGEMGWTASLTGISAELAQYAQCVTTLADMISKGEIPATANNGQTLPRNNGQALPRAPQKLPTTETVPNYQHL